MNTQWIKKNVLLFSIGALILIIGITLILIWWQYAVRLFKGFMGMGLAFLGMVLMFLSSE